MQKFIDLNCDMGEFSDPSQGQLDESIMPLISRCNIAVGGHAGNKQTIKHSFAKASQHNLHIGIHPGYADPDNFGRKVLNQPWNITKDSLIEQIELGLNIAEQMNISVNHIKFHGALYNQIETDQELAIKVVELIKDYSDLTILGMANGLLQKACPASITFIREAFLDRRYLTANQLQPRSQTGAVFHQLEDILQQALAIAADEPITSAAGQELTVQADSLCIHSDTPNALSYLKALRNHFSEAGIKVT